MDLTRRGFLAAALAIGLAGCVPMPNPRLDVPTPTGGRPPIWQKAADAETAIATAYTAAASVITGGADWCKGAAALHAAHAATMSLANPWSGLGLGTPVTSAGATDAKTALSQLERAISDATTTITAGLKQAANGPEALLWASLLVCLQVGSVWCADTTVKRPAPKPGTVVPYEITVDPVADAATAALDRCYALRFALTTSLGRTARNGQLHADLANALTQVGTMVASLMGLLMASGATPPAPELSYTLPSGLGDNDAIRATWGAMEASLGQACTYLAGCLTGDDAVTWATTAGDQMARATAMGQTLTWWPGWG